MTPRALAKDLRGACLAAALLAAPLQASAATLQLAVAANFAKTAEALGQAYAAHGGDTISIASASTGKLYAQIANGAPFDLFFAADTRRPQKLTDDQLVLADSYFVYARGRLALYGARLAAGEDIPARLRRADFTHLAIANPKTAPYGAAAEQVMQTMGVLESLRPKIVTGESISQAFQFAVTGNAELGFVALSQLDDPGSPAYRRGAYWLPSEAMYTPIDQAAVILKRCPAPEAAQRFVDFVRSAAGRTIIESYGYAVPVTPGHSP